MQVVDEDGNTFYVNGETEHHYIANLYGIPIQLSKEAFKPFKEKPEQVKKEEKKVKHSHYHKDVSKLETIDVYKVCELFDVDDKSGAIHHAVKKLLCSGYRGVKDKRQDVQEAVDTLNRWLEMNKEK